MGIPRMKPPELKTVLYSGMIQSSHNFLRMMASIIRSGQCDVLTLGSSSKTKALRPESTENLVRSLLMKYSQTKITAIKTKRIGMRRWRAALTILVNLWPNYFLNQIFNIYIK